MGIAESIKREVFLLGTVYGEYCHIIVFRQFLSDYRRHPLYATKREDGVGQKADSFHNCVQKYRENLIIPKKSVNLSA